MHIRLVELLLLVYLWQEIAMVLGVTYPKRDVGIARQVHALHLDQSQPNSHQKCASTQIFEPTNRQRFPRSSRPVKVFGEMVQTIYDSDHG